MSWREPKRIGPFLKVGIEKESVSCHQPGQAWDRRENISAQDLTRDFGAYRSIEKISDPRPGRKKVIK